MSKHPMLYYALAYRRKLNWSVIPVNAKQKSPYVKWKKYQTELPTIADIKDWWTKYPDANIALITGRLSGVVVFDCDSKEAIEHIENKGYESTRIVQSNRGRHYYFQYPEEWKNRIKSFVGKEVGNIDIDVKADGGSITLPPSIHQKGTRYKWICGTSYPLANLDHWMLQYIDKTKSGKEYWKYFNPLSASSKVAEYQYGVDKGLRNKAAFRMACSLKARGFSEHDIYRKIAEWDMMNKPPLTKKEYRYCINSALGKK